MTQRQDAAFETNVGPKGMSTPATKTPLVTSFANAGRLFLRARF